MWPTAQDRWHSWGKAQGRGLEAGSSYPGLRLGFLRWEVSIRLLLPKALRTCSPPGAGHQEDVEQSTRDETWAMQRVWQVGHGEREREHLLRSPVVFRKEQSRHVLGEHNS